MSGAKLRRIGADHAQAARALVCGCLLVLAVTACGGGGGSAPTNESWRSGWQKDRAKAPVADASVYVDWYVLDKNPAWSPNGAWIAFDGTRRGGGIYVVHPNGRGLRRIAGSRSGAFPAWSPNSRQLAFSTSKASSWWVATDPRGG
jgi:WD40-like Beta Propeller Repeat